MNERIKQLRLTLGLNQEEFGKALGLAKSGVSNLENGFRNVTKKHIRMLVMSFNVNEEWLLTGKGEMFLAVDTAPLYALKKQYNLSERAIYMITKFVQLSHEEQELFIDILCSLTGKQN